MSAWGDLLRTLAKNPISTFAVLCVAATASFLGYLTHRMVDVLESPIWCGRAIQAERISAENFKGLEGCVEILKIQLQSMSLGFHIAVSAYALTLIVLIVIVVAGARASGKVGASGIQFDVSREGEAAQHVADEAQDAADEVKAETKPADKLPDYAR